MKVKDLLKVLQNEVSKNKNFGEKTITFYDFKNKKCYIAPDKPTFIDFSDDNYFDIVFNL